jgi:hypothetical protein
LKEHVPGPYVHPKYVEEFHQVLDLLENASQASLENFRIPATEIKPMIAGMSRRGGATYTTEPYCERALFEMRVDGVLTMFELLMNSTGNPKGSIGFSTPKK